MNDETTFTPKPGEAPPLGSLVKTLYGDKPSESTLLNMSVRAWIGVIIVLTMCALCIAVVIIPVIYPSIAQTISPASIPDVLKDAFLVTIAFYYGQASKPKTQQ